MQDKRRSLIPYSGSGYSTVLKSPLSQMITILDKSLRDIDAHYTGKTSKDETHSKTQLLTIKSIFVVVNEILNFFTNGIKPSGLGDLIQIGYGLNKLQGLLPIFYTPAYALFNILGKSTKLFANNNYIDQLSAAFEKINNQPISDENSAVFKKELKNQLKENFDKFSANICQDLIFDKQLFLNKLYSAIDNFDFKILNTHPEAKSRALFLENMLGGALFSFSDNAVGDKAQKKYKKYHFQVLDNKTYDFAMQTLALIAQAPADFKSLFSFFDPASVDDLGFNGFGQVKSIKSKSTAKTPGYAVEITGELTGTMQIDLAESYDLFIEGFSNQIAEEISQYRENNSRLSFVESDLAKTRLIRAYIEKEHRNMSECAGVIIANRAVVLEQEITQEMSISELSTWLEILKKIEDNFAILKKKSNDFNCLKFVELIKGDADLLVQLGVDETRSNDTGYQFETIPEVLVYKDENNKNARCEIKKYVFEVMIANRLLDSEGQFKQRIEEIKKILRPKIQDLSELEINQHKQQNLSHEEKLNEIVLSAKAIIRANEYVFQQDLEERVNYIAVEKKSLDLQIEALKDSRQQIQNIQAKIAEQSQHCSSLELKEWDATAIFKNISACYVSSREKTELCIAQLNKLSTGLQAKMENLEWELNTVKATIALNKTLESSNPDSIRILKEEKQQAQEKLLKERVLLLQEKAINEAKAEPDRTKEQAIAIKNQACVKTKAEISKQLRQIETPLHLLSGEAKEIFKDKTFNTVEAIQNAKKWLQGLMESYNQAMTTTPKMIYHYKLRRSLVIVQDSVEIADKKPFPFEWLDGQLKPVFDNYFWQKGFDDFLEIFGFTIEERSKWSSYRSKGQNTPEFETDKQDLLTKVINKRKEIDTADRTQKELETYAQNQGAIKLLCELLVSLEKETTEAINATTSYQSERLEIDKASKDTDLVLTEKITKNEKDQDALISNIEIFGQIENIMYGNQQLGRQICEIEKIIGANDTVEKLNKARKQVTDLFLQLGPLTEQLKESMDILEQKIPNEEKEIYIAYIERLDTLISDSEKRSGAIFNVLVTNSQSKIKNIVDILNRIKSESGPMLAAVKPENEEFVPWILDQISKFKGISNLINQVLTEKARVFQELNFDTTGKLQISANAQIGDLEEDAKAIIESLPAHLDTMVKPLTDKLTADLAANSKLIQGDEAINYLSSFPLKDLNILKESFDKNTPTGAVLTGISAEFESQVSRVNRKYSEQIAKIQELITAIQIDKTRLTYQRNNVNFEQIKLKINSLIEKLANKSPENFKVLDQQMVELNNKYIEKYRDHDLQKREILARYALAEKYTSEIDNYIIDRAKAYSVKDRFFSGDKEEREDFQDKLEDELDSYVESANSKGLRDLLNQSFSGYQLKPILNRLNIELKKQNLSSEELPKRAAGKKLAPIQNPALIAKFSELRDEIESIKSFANSLDEDKYDNYQEIANKLADSLSEGMDQFLLKYEVLVERNASSADKTNALSQFQEDFTCLLNSQNDVLSQHVSWGPILANIGLAILGVCTGGISLGVQAVVAKGILQRDSMWVRSEVISRVADMEDVAGDIGRFNMI